jgi:hypothetical protein
MGLRLIRLRIRILCLRPFEMRRLLLKLRPLMSHLALEVNLRRDVIF